MSTIIGYLIGQVGQLSGARFAIPESGLIIGRDPNHASLVVEDSLVSRQHAKIAPAKDGKLYLIDLQSRNGTSLNGKKVTTPVTLCAGDKIELGTEGKVIFIFESADTTSLSGVLKEAFGETVAPVEWKAGDNILGIYEVTGILGQGGMGRVYKVHHKSWNMDLAVKSPLPGHFTDKKAVASFVREAETWSNLNLHPNIVQCYYVRTIGGIPRIFAEYVPGGTLGSWIKNRKLTQLDQILDVAIQFAWGLHAAHEQGIVHQDIKPANVLMTEDGSPKVTDFGLARSRPVSTAIIPPDQSALVSFAGGTPAYCSPEQARGKKLSRKTDIWSWAATVLHMFIGNIVWQSGLQTPRVLKNYRKLFGPKFLVRMPKRVAKVLESCLSGRVEDRPKDMQEVAAYLMEAYQAEFHRPYNRMDFRAVDHAADGLNNRALSLLDLGQTKQADHLWREALRIDPEHLESVYNFGLHQWRAAQIDDWALAMRLRMAGMKTVTPRTNLLLAQVKLESGNAEAASELLKTVDNADAFYPELRSLRVLAQQSIQNSRRFLRIFKNEAHTIASACLSRDAKYAVSGSWLKTIQLWEVETGRCLRTFEGHTEGYTKVCLSGDNRYVLSGSEDSTLRLWDASTGRCLRTFEGHTWGVDSVCLSADNLYALSGSYDTTLRLWNVTTGHCLRIFEGHTGPVRSVCLSADNRLALSGSFDNTLRLWDVSTGRCLRIFLGQNTNRIESVCLSDDNRYALSGSDTVRLWDVGTGRCLRTFNGHAEGIDSVCLSTDNRYALSGSWDKTLRLWNVTTGRCLRTFEGHTDSINSVCLSGDNRYALSGSADDTMRLWKISDQIGYIAPWEICRVEAANKLLAVRSQFDELVRMANQALSEDDVLKAVGAIKQARALPGQQKTTAALDTWRELYSRLPKSGLAGGWLEQTFEGHTNDVTSVCLSWDGKFALSGSWDSTIRLWEVTSGRGLKIISGHKERIRSVCFSGNSRHILTASGLMIRLLETNTGRCLRTFEGHSSPVTTVSLTRDGLYVLSGSCPDLRPITNDNTLRLWEVRTGRCLRTFLGHTEGINSACLSEDGRYALSGAGRTLAEGSKDNTLRLWDLASGRNLQIFEGHTNGIGSVCFSRNGQYALSGSADKTLRLWDVGTGRCLQTFEGHTNRINSVCLSGDNRFALSVSDDKTLRLWNVATGGCLRILEGHVGRVNSVCLSADNRYALSGGVDKTLRLWALDWELEDKQPANWDEGARPYLENFLTLHTPYGSQLPENRTPTEEEITLAFTRRGKPAWTEDDFKTLLYTLGCAGYGWLRPEGVRHELEKLTKAWSEPPPLL